MVAMGRRVRCEDAGEASAGAGGRGGRGDEVGEDVVWPRTGSARNASSRNREAYNLRVNFENFHVRCKFL